MFGNMQFDSFMFGIISADSLPLGAVIAMLTMIAETMLPEAFEKGGSVTGLSTLLGFLTAILFKELG